jgi:hypothetical protein
MNDIEKLEARVEDLTLQLGKARAALQAARNNAAGVALGMLVKDRKGQVYQVTSIEHWCNAVSLHGRKQLKGGGWHSRPQYIGTCWTKVS